MVCDRCDGGAEVQEFGWIVWRGRPPGASEFVFRSPEDAKRWRDANRLSHYPIRRVSTEAKIHWRQSTGSLKQIELADRLFEIYPTVRYPPADNRAHLA